MEQPSIRAAQPQSFFGPKYSRNDPVTQFDVIFIKVKECFRGASVMDPYFRDNDQNRQMLVGNGTNMEGMLGALKDLWPTLQ